MKTLREILKERNIKYSVVADALGIHVNHIARYDNLSKRSLEEILKISEVTGISVKELLDIRPGNNNNVSFWGDGNSLKDVNIGHGNNWINHQSEKLDQSSIENESLRIEIESLKKEIEHQKNLLNEKERYIQTLESFLKK